MVIQLDFKVCTAHPHTLDQLILVFLINVLLAELGSVNSSKKIIKTREKHNNVPSDMPHKQIGLSDPDIPGALL